MFGWCNVDLDPHTAADVTDDIGSLRKFPDAFAELIYACHVLEHMSHDAVLPTLRAWHRVLRPGDEVFISVPDLDRIVRIYSKNWEHFQTRPNAPWIGLIYGGQTDMYDFHRTVRDIEEYPHEPHPFGIADASLAAQPFGEFISLKVRATKP